MAKTEEMCEGCIAIGDDLSSNLLCIVRTDFKEHDDCPCGNCIVKVMCSRECEERISYYYDRRQSETKLVS